MSVVYTKNKNSELLPLTNVASRKGKRIPWICDYMKIRWDLEWKQSICLKVHKYRKNNGLLNSFFSSILLQLESSNFWEFWYFQDGRTLVSKFPTFKTLFAFVVLTLFKLPDPGASIYVRSLLKFPTWGAQGRSKSPPHPVVPPLGHNIDSCIIYSNGQCQQQQTNVKALATLITVHMQQVCISYLLFITC